MVVPLKSFSRKPRPPAAQDTTLEIATDSLQQMLASHLCCEAPWEPLLLLVAVHCYLLDSYGQKYQGLSSSVCHLQ